MAKAKRKPRLKDLFARPPSKLSLPEGYTLLPDEMFLPLADDDQVPANYFAGPHPPIKEEIDSMLANDENSIVLWHNTTSGLVMELDISMHNAGHVVPFVPADSSVLKLVIDLDSTDVLGKIVHRDAVTKTSSASGAKISLGELVSRVKEGRELTEIFTED